MMIFEVLRNGEVIWSELVSKVAKEANLGNFPKLYRYRYRAVPVHPHQKPTCTGTGLTCTGTGLTCTGTPQQNATCTGTGQRCTGTGVPKMPRLCSFCVIKLKVIHRKHRNLIK